MRSPRGKTKGRIQQQHQHQHPQHQQQQHDDDNHNNHSNNSKNNTHPRNQQPYYYYFYWKISLFLLPVMVLVGWSIFISLRSNKIFLNTTSMMDGGFDTPAFLLEESLILFDDVFMLNSSRNTTNTRTTVSSSPTTNHTINDTTETIPEVKRKRITTTSKHAYAFVIGGCTAGSRTTTTTSTTTDDDDDVLLDQLSYRNYIYNVIVATKILRDLGSVMDVVVMIQMIVDPNDDLKSNSRRTRTRTTTTRRRMKTEEETNHKQQQREQGVDRRYPRLPIEDERILHEMNISIRYIQPQIMNSFYRTQLDKFRILGLTQYDKVLYMDGDIMPTANLDYLFELSDSGILKNNMIMEGRMEPANGGFFMLQTGYIQQIQDIITKREQYAQTLQYPYFDINYGWGQKNISWTCKSRPISNNWTFHAAFADQGLLYYYVKYIRQDVSVIMRKSGGFVENWSSSSSSSPSTTSDGDDNNTTTVQPILEKTLNNPYQNITIRVPQSIVNDESNNQSRRRRKKKSICLDWGGNCRYDVGPIRHYVHYTGNGKPWMMNRMPLHINTSNMYDTSRHYWHYILRQLDQQLNLQLNIINVTTKNTNTVSTQQQQQQEKVDTTRTISWSSYRQRKPSLGLYPDPSSVLTANTNLLTELYE